MTEPLFLAFQEVEGAYSPLEDAVNGGTLSYCLVLG
jgi:hypothetical protein